MCWLNFSKNSKNRKVKAVLASPTKKTGDNMQQTFTTTALATILGGLCISSAIAQSSLPDPAATDPQKLGWMQGFRPRRTNSFSLPMAAAISSAYPLVVLTFP
jgi:hypothetical protein